MCTSTPWVPKWACHGAIGAVSPHPRLLLDVVEDEVSRVLLGGAERLVGDKPRRLDTLVQERGEAGVDVCITTGPMSSPNATPAYEAATGIVGDHVIKCTRLVARPYLFEQSLGTHVEHVGRRERNELLERKGQFPAAGAAT